MADTFHSNIPDFSKFMKSLDLLVGISTDKRIMLKDLIPQYSTIHIGNYSKLIERNPDIPQQVLDMNNVSDTVKIVKGISRRECNVS